MSLVWLKPEVGIERETIEMLSSIYSGIFTSFYTFMNCIESNFSETAELELPAALTN